MSSHWRPEGKIVRLRAVRARREWVSVDDYVQRRLRGHPLPASLTLGAVFIGVVAWLAWQNWPAQPRKSGPTAPIEWNAVQAVPTRAPDGDDLAWEKRARLEPFPSWGGSGGGEQRVPSAADAASPPPTSPTRGKASDGIYVIDGDTFGIGSQHIRIANIDTPETHPPRCMEEARLGLAATQKLRELLSSGTVTVSGASHDQYGRELRSVQVNGQDVGEAMISAGLARSYDGKKRQGWCN